jgi:predicted acylesterase/phospholipase RssA
MSRRGDRPQFDVVTGVSVGALIAPVAFLGSAWDQELADAFDSEWPEHALDRRGLEFLFRPGLYKSEPLVDVIGHFVTDRLVKAVAHEAARGRLLLVATTDLDKQEAVIWDMGAIAAQGGERARVLFRDVLVASASIPGVFPPVLIHVEGDGKSYDEMHVDGGTTMPLFIASEIAQLESRRFDAFSGAEIFVLVNTQLAAYPKSTRERPIAVLRKSFSAGLTHSLRSSLELTAAFAQRNGMDFHLSYIPMSYPYQGSLSLKFPAMHALFDYGARCAETGRLWTTLEQAIQEEQQAASTLPRTTEDCPAPGTARQPAVPESTAAASLAR